MSEFMDEPNNVLRLARVLLDSSYFHVEVEASEFARWLIARGVISPPPAPLPRDPAADRRSGGSSEARWCQVAYHHRWRQINTKGWPLLQQCDYCHRVVQEAEGQ